MVQFCCAYANFATPIKGAEIRTRIPICVTSRFSRYIIDYCPYHVIVISCFFIHLYIRQIAILFKAEFAYFLVVCGSLEQFALLVSYCLPKWVLRVCLRAFSTPPVGNDTVGYEYPLWNSRVVIDLHYLRTRFSSVSITIYLNFLMDHLCNYLCSSVVWPSFSL